MPGLVLTTSFASSGEITTEKDVAEATYRAATGPDCPIIVAAGADAIAWSKAS